MLTLHIEIPWIPPSRMPMLGIPDSPGPVSRFHHGSTSRLFHHEGDDTKVQAPALHPLRLKISFPPAFSESGAGRATHAKEAKTMHDHWMNNQHRYGSWADPEIVELTRTHGYYLENDLDPEIWSEADWQEFERDRVAFENHHAGKQSI
jgi:hypothetical protein